MNISYGVLIAVIGVFINNVAIADVSNEQASFINSSTFLCSDYVSDIGELQADEEVALSVEYVGWMRSRLVELHESDDEQDSDLAELLEGASGLSNLRSHVSWIICYCEEHPSILYAEAVTNLWERLRSEQHADSDAGARGEEEAILRCMEDTDVGSKAALAFINRLAEQGDADAQLKLGFMYGMGTGVSQDETESVRWVRKAAEQGHAGAQFGLASAYDEGLGVPQDYTEAVKWYRKAAEQGHAEAQAKLGASYMLGVGVPQDLVEAVNWMRKAAEQGLAQAQLALGAAYDDGVAVDQDYAEAVKWYREAAEQGYARAQSDLGNMYEHGLGVPRDIAEAVKWYRKAAEQGDTTAQRLLREATAKISGVPQDPTEIVCDPTIVAEFKPELTYSERYRQSTMIGNWVGDNVLDSGGVSRFLVQRYADGTFKVTFKTWSREAVLEVHQQVGQWGVSGPIYFTITTGHVVGDLIDPTVPGHPYNYDAYRIIAFEDDYFEYESFSPKARYALRRVADDFEADNL